MRSRVFALLMTLVCVVLVALGVPLALALARAEQQDVFLDRLNDTTRFASLAGEIGSEVDRAVFERDLERYDQVYGIAVTLLDRSGAVVARSRAASMPDDEVTRTRIARAERGHETDSVDLIWPWQDDPLVVAGPVTRAGEVTGVLLTASPTGHLRGAVLRSWLLLLAGELLAAAFAVVVATRLARWIVRPVAQLDEMAHEISTGRFDARVPAGGGPPELRRLAVSFNGMADHVERTVEAQRAFVADASHQLRNPLAALLLRIEHLGLALPDGRREELDAARTEGRRLTAVLESLLGLARAEGAAPPAQRVDLAALAADRVEQWSVLADRRSVTVTLAPPRDPVVVHGDPVAVSSALDAIVDNAVKFSPDDGVVILTVGREEPGTGFVRVTDSGPGLQPDELARAGDRFWRSPRHQNVPGTGLGLAVARSLVQPYGGSLVVATRRPGPGLEVSLVLRAAPSARARLRVPRLQGFSAR